MGRPGADRAEFTEAVNAAKRLNRKPDIANCYDGLGAAALEGAFTEARDWYEEERIIGEEWNDE